MSNEDRPYYTREELIRGALKNAYETNIAQLEFYLSKRPQDTRLQQKLLQTKSEYTAYLEEIRGKVTPKMSMSIGVQSIAVTELKVVGAQRRRDNSKRKGK